MLKVRKTIKSLLCLLLAVTVMLFAGCKAQVDVYESSDDDNWYFRIDIGIDNSLDNLLNESAAQSEKYNKQWTLSDWFGDYFAELSELYGFTYRYNGIYSDTDTKQKIYRFTEITVPKHGSSEYIRDALTLDPEYSISTNLFFRKIHAVRDNRFDFFVNEFEGVKDRFERGEPIVSDNETAMGILLFGLVNLYPQYENRPNHPDIANNPEFKYDPESGAVFTVALPGFTDAFPIAGTEEYFDGYTKIFLRELWFASRKMTVECDDRMVITDEYGNVDNSGVYYIFTKTVADGETEVVYDYRRADPTGWYILAVVFGGAAVGITILVARMNKSKREKLPPPKPQDNFPYDPFNGNIDPFA